MDTCEDNDENPNKRNGSNLDSGEITYSGEITQTSGVQNNMQSFAYNSGEYNSGEYINSREAFEVGATSICNRGSMKFGS